MIRDKEVIDYFTERQTNRTADDTAPKGVGEGFCQNHFGKLSAIHAYCPHRAILPNTGRYAHGDAVHDVQHSNQRDNAKKSIDAGNKGKISARCAFIPLIVHGITAFLHDLTNGGYIFIRCVGSSLNHNERIIGDRFDTERAQCKRALHL